MKRTLLLLMPLFFVACKQEKKEITPDKETQFVNDSSYAKGFHIEKMPSGITLLQVKSPWPNAETTFTYALVPKTLKNEINLKKGAYDAVIHTPIEKIVVTSTTHIPALEELGVIDALVGFPNTVFVSSAKARKRIDEGLIKELGNNESINTEMTISLAPDAVIGFGINNQNKAYNTLIRSKVPVVYNGDWTEETPLGKAEWIKFFAPFFQKEKEADRIFKKIETAYNKTKLLATKATHKPTVLTGGLYKDVWYVAGGKSWMAQFLKDAQTAYLWKNTPETGSISLSVESVLAKGQKAQFWLNPSMHTSYAEMAAFNQHYEQFEGYKNKKVFSNTIAKGPSGGLLFYELAPQRPDLVLKDLIHIFHPALLPEHELYFFKPLD